MQPEPRIRASIVIPAHGRVDLLGRAYASVLACPGADEAEVIIVDDCSDPPLSLNDMRPQDRLVRMKAKRGAAVARNVGMDAAVGDFVYLLDSDDTFLQRDFSADPVALDEGTLYYCEIRAGRESRYPTSIAPAELIECLMYRHPHVCQTSSLCFSRSLGLRFDEALPKHQDWDFVLSASQRGVPVAKGPGLVFFDASDKSSLSRVYDASRSMPWLDKVRASPLVQSVDKQVIHFHVLAKYLREIGWARFARQSLVLLAARRTSLRFVSRALAHRLIQLVRRQAPASRG